jgi:hypothetical protein
MQHIPGLELSAYFFNEAVQPLLSAHFPDLPYSAARLGYGSDVLGFDTPMSMDHGWGPKLTLFLSEDNHAVFSDAIDHTLAHHLPFEIRGFPTHFGEPLADGGVMALKNQHPIHHMVQITTPERFFREYLGVSITQPLTPADWLGIPQQRLRTLRSGRVFHDGLGRLQGLRKIFEWYPPDLWRYLLACQWQRIDQNEPFPGRAGSVGDEMGSHLLASQLIRDLMRLAFLMEKQYAPYQKWFGTAFGQLKTARNLTPVFEKVMSATDWQTREKHLSSAYILMASEHNTQNLTQPIPAEVSRFYSRPFLVLHASQFVTALRESIQDPAIQSLPPHLGSVDQISDNTDILENVALCRKIIDIYTKKTNVNPPNETNEKSVP